MTTIIRLIACAAVVATGLGGAALAGEAQDRLFRTDMLGDVATGQALVFRHERGGTLAADPVPPIEDGTLEVALQAAEGGARAARVELLEGGAPRSRAVLSAAGGHPVLLIFLETSARNVAALTGGSPFYIKNRMREALGDDVAVEAAEVTVDGETVPAERVTFHPFRDDAHRSELGAFADLALTVTMSDAVPGGFARFEAAAAPGADGAQAFSETFVYDHIEEE